MKLHKGPLWDYVTKNYNLEYRKALLSLLEVNGNAIYLDLGCGNGDLTIKCARKIQAKMTWGLDLVMDKLIEAKAQYQIHTGQTAVDEDLPFPSNSFDLVTANQIVEHLNNTDMFFKEIYRVLKPGGYLVISTNNLAAAHWILMFIVGIQPPTASISDEMQVKEFGNYKGEKLHRRLFTVRGLEKVLKYFGFQIEKSIGTYYPPLPIWMGRVLCKIDKYHASCITIKARKSLND